MPLNKLFSNKKGFLLGEVLMAIFLLTLIAAVVGGIINNSLKTSQFSRNFIIAQSLASEAIENVTSLRNTNWLLHAGNSNCWLLLDPTDNCPEGEMAVAGTDYITSKSPSGYRLVAGPDGGFTPESDLNEFYRLYLVPFWETQIYTDGENYADDGEASAFYRAVTFDSIEADQSQALVTVKLAWKEGAKDRSLSRTFVLSNF